MICVSSSTDGSSERSRAPRGPARDAVAGRSSASTDGWVGQPLVGIGCQFGSSSNVPGMVNRTVTVPSTFSTAMSSTPRAYRATVNAIRVASGDQAGARFDHRATRQLLQIGTVAAHHVEVPVTIVASALEDEPTTIGCPVSALIPCRVPRQSGLRGSVGIHQVDVGVVSFPVRVGDLAAVGRPRGK